MSWGRRDKMSDVDEPVTCLRCAAPRDRDDPVVALSWVTERVGGRLLWLCPRCARNHARDIETKLDHEYW
jgi:hypothetical protein